MSVEVNSENLMPDIVSISERISPEIFEALQIANTLKAYNATHTNT